MHMRARLRQFPMVGAVLLVSGSMKAWDAIRHGGEPHSHPASQLLGKRTELALTTVELATAVTDLLLGRRRLAGIGGAGLFAGGLVSFTAARARGQRIHCRCFGALSRGEVGVSAYVRNGLLLAIAANQASMNAGNWPSSRFRPDRRTVSVVVGVVLCMETLLIGYLVLLLASLRRSRPPAEPLKLIQQGEVVPHFEVLGHEDKPVDLVECYAQRGHPRILVLVGSSDCKGCHALWDAVLQHTERVPSKGVDVAFIWLGGVPGEPEQSEHGPTPRIQVGGRALRSDWEFTDLYGSAQGAFGLARVPVAIVLGREGQVLERPSLGQDAALTRWKRWAEEQPTPSTSVSTSDGWFTSAS